MMQTPYQLGQQMTYNADDGNLASSIPQDGIAWCHQSKSWRACIRWGSQVRGMKKSIEGVCHQTCELKSSLTNAQAFYSIPKVFNLEKRMNLCDKMH